MNVPSTASMYANLQHALRNPIERYRVKLWSKWYDQAHVTILHNNSINLANKGCSLDRCLDILAQGEPEPWNDKIRRKQKREIQKVTTSFLKESGKINAENRIRERLCHWMDKDAAGPSDHHSIKMMIAGPPRWVAQRATSRLQRLPKLVPPRVCSAAFRTLFNGWCTARRFQCYDTCMLGCGSSAGDKIEHYCRCPVTRELFRKKLRIDLHPTMALSCFVMTTKEQNEDEILALTMLGVYAIYMCTNHYRHGAKHKPRNREHAMQYLGQCLIQGCQGHKELTRIFDKRWESPVARIDKPPDPHFPPS